MTTSNMVGAATALQIGSFDSSSFKSFMQKGHTFQIDLSEYSLIQVLEAYATFKRKTSPRFSNSAVIGRVAEIQEYLDGQVIMPIDVTDEFYVFFQQYLISGDKVVKPSTVKNYFTNIRAALGWASKHNCKISETFNLFKVSDYEKTKVVLSPEQIAHIYYFDIDANKERIYELAKQHNLHRLSFTFMNKVRDHFVLSCNIGQRYSDVIRLDPASFDSTKTIYKTTQQKTGGKAAVYLQKYAITLKIAIEILNKYNYHAPVTQDINNYNKVLHLLLHAIGGEFLETVRSSNKIMGEIVTEDVPMWKAITSHTARRTFASSGLMRGFSIPQIQKCTGHKDLRSLSHYMVLSDTD